MRRTSRCWLHWGNSRHGLFANGNGKHHFVRTTAVIAQVGGDYIVRITELKGFLQPISHHGAICIVRSVGSTEPNRVLVPDSPRYVQLGGYGVHILEHEGRLDDPVLPGTEPVATRNIVVVFQLTERFVLVIEEVDLVPEQLGGRGAEPELGMVEVERELGIGHQFAPQLIVHGRVSRIPQGDLGAIDQELEQAGR